MSQQALDLRRSVQIVRRHRKLFGAVAALGLLGGVAFAILKPPVLTSTALVVLPQSYSQSLQAAAGSASTNAIDTQVVIATSDAVLADALPHISPAMSAQTLATKIQVTNVAGSVLSFSATGSTAQQAEATANAVANSYIAYIGSPSSPLGHVPAKVLEQAAAATGTKLPEQIGIFGLLGLLAGALIGFIISLAIGLNDRRLVERDAIANSIAAPVLAAIPAGHPSDAGSWIKLIEQYEPEIVHAWALNNLLQRLGVTELNADNSSDDSGCSLTVLSLSSDPGALALGPQLAAFAASLGIPTALILGPQQNANVTATLRTACTAQPQAVAGRGKLRLFASDDSQPGRVRGAFVVVVAVIDPAEPQLPAAIHTDATVLGVSAGAATAAQLARAATAAASVGQDIIGILVANPEPTDQTSGRMPRLASPLRRALPTRTQSVPMEGRR
jgi:capsular polysaccharide biosynthesis protein